MHDTDTTAAIEAGADTPSDAAGTGYPAPRTRWAAILWGVTFAAIAVWGLWTFSDDARRTATHDWAIGLTPASAVAYALLATGALLVLLGSAALLRRAQRRREQT